MLCFGKALLTYILFFTNFTKFDVSYTEKER